MSTADRSRPFRERYNKRVSLLVPSILIAMAVTLGVWVHDNHSACSDRSSLLNYVSCFAHHNGERVRGLYNLRGWQLLRDIWVYNMVVVFVATTGTTILGLLMHRAYLRSWQRGEIKTVGNVVNPDVTTYDVVRFFAYNPAAAWPLYAWMIYYAGSGLVTTRMPTIGDVIVSFAMLPITFVVFDIFQYAGHRWMHATKIEWIREMHMEHHRSAPQMEGLIFTDLMSTNPFEYWINFNPGCMVVLEIFKYGLPLLGISGNWWGYWFNIVCLVFNATVGHLNYDVPQHEFLSSLGFGSLPDHSMHHYNPRKNFANYSVWLDKLMGTHEPFPQLPASSEKAPLDQTMPGSVSTHPPQEQHVPTVAVTGEKPVFD